MDLDPFQLSSDLYIDLVPFLLLSIAPHADAPLNYCIGHWCIRLGCESLLSSLLEVFLCSYSKICWATKVIGSSHSSDQAN